MDYVQGEDRLELLFQLAMDLEGLDLFSALDYFHRIIREFPEAGADYGLASGL